MSRKYNTRKDGSPFNSETIETVWDKANRIFGQSPDAMRTDNCGFLICRDEFNNQYSVTGWEIDHIIPVSEGGSDDLENLQPLQWKNNRLKGDKADWDCPGFKDW